MAKREQPFTNFADSGENDAARPKKRRESNEAARDRMRRLREGTNRSAFKRGGREFFPSTPPDIIATSRISPLVEMWLQDGEIALHSPRTAAARRQLLNRLIRFLEEAGKTHCGGDELKMFFARLRNEKTGEALSIDTVETFRRAFNAFWHWMQKEGHVAKCAMDAVPPIPIAKRKAKAQVQPFGEEQVKALFATALKSTYPRRDLALLSLLLDTGIRAEECADIRLSHMDFDERSMSVVGKGDKRRTVFFDKLTSAALWAHLQERGVHPSEDKNEALFVAMSGANAGCPMTRSGIYQAIEKLVSRCGITDGKKGPHRLRHTFATMSIRNGAYQDTVQQMLGHSDPRQTQRYVTLADADMRNQHAKTSPIANLKKKK